MYVRVTHILPCTCTCCVCVCSCSVVEAFLQRVPDSVSSKDGYSHTVLHCAAFQDQLDIITLAMDKVYYLYMYMLFMCL